MSGFFSQFFSRINSSMQSQISGIARITSKITNLTNSALQKIQSKITRNIKVLTSKPKSKKDYWKIFGIYFAKRFVVVGVLSVGAVIFIFYSIVFPRCEGYLWYAKLLISNSKAQQFTGKKVKLYDIDKKLIYQGEMSSGKPKGFGIQYDLNGNLKYKGNFDLGKYSGTGELFDSLGNLKYSGSFQNNKYSGMGQLFNTSGKITYIGEFDGGIRSGKGTEYDPKSGAKKYYGEFADDKYEGRGVLYSPGGEIISYEGDFKNGMFDGNGKKYSSGHLVYSGAFKNGKYSGSGILYDASSGNILYSGDFEEGVYSGNGKLYDKNTFDLLYEGEFAKGMKNGAGILYDKLGISVFNGDFKNDGIDFVSHFGKSEDDIREKFGTENKRINSGEKIIFLYTSIDSVLIFGKDKKGKNAFECAIIGKKFDFMGIRDSSSTKRCSILGQPYSSTHLELNQFQRDSFSILNLSSIYSNTLKSDKYTFENYFIRTFFAPDEQTVEAIEIGKS